MSNTNFIGSTTLFRKMEIRWLSISFLFLSVVGLIVFFQNYIKYATTVEHFSISLSLLYNLIVFSTYAVFAPLIVKALYRFPVGKHQASNYLVHFGFSILLGLLHMVLCNLILYGIDLSSSPIFPRFIMKYLTNVIQFHLLVYWIIVGFTSLQKASLKENSTGTLDRLLIKENRSTRFLELDKVLWIEALDHYQKLYTENGFSIYKDSMSNLVKQLPADKFKRIHRSTIVRVSQLKELKKESGQLAVRLHSGKELAVGKSYRSEVKRLFN